jgi:hypothetical protein
MLCLGWINNLRSSERWLKYPILIIFFMGGEGRAIGERLDCSIFLWQFTSGAERVCLTIGISVTSPVSLKSEQKLQETSPCLNTKNNSLILAHKEKWHNILYFFRKLEWKKNYNSNAIFLCSIVCCFMAGWYQLTVLLFMRLKSSYVHALYWFSNINKSM